MELSDPPRLRPATAETRPASTSSEALRWALRILLVAAAYYVAARLGLRLALVKKNVTPLWPPTGIAVVAFLVLGRRVWPGIALSAFLVNLPISAGLPAALATAAGNTLAPLLAATLLSGWDFDWSSTGCAMPSRSCSSGHWSACW